MKKILFVLLLAFTITAANAQTSIIISNVMHDSILGYNTLCCNKTETFYYNVGGIAHGYNPITDSITLILQFGDGIDTTLKTNLVNDSLFGFSFFNGLDYAHHHYANTGGVDIKVYVIAPDGKKDSVVQYCLIGDTCDYIKGDFYHDLNNNCLMDGSETTYGDDNVRLWYNNYDITHNIGWNGTDFLMYAPIGFAYDLITTNNVNGIYCPSVYHVNAVPDSGSKFGYHCGNNFDLSAYFCGYNFKLGSTTAEIRGDVINFDCLAVNNGKVKLVYDNTLLTPTSSYNPYTVSGDTIIWDFVNLNSFYSGASNFFIKINFTVSPLAQLGNQVCFTLIELPKVGDIDTNNNTQYACYTISNSWDPNDKQVTPQGEGANGYINNNQNMFYTIHFQNTGNAAAGNVYIIDTLDNNLDMGTFGKISSSHYCKVSFLKANIVKYDFLNINLPDSGTNQQLSNGYVTYSVRQKPNLAIATQIKNTAYIYFDYNPAVVTNTTLNTIKSTTSIKEIKNENEISIYPNPSSGIFTVALGNLDRNCKVEVLNSYGQIVYESALENQTLATIDLSRQAKGMYFIKVRSEQGVVIRKVIVE